MRVVVLVSALLLLAVGTFSCVTYNALHQELRGNHRSDGYKGKKKSVFFIEFGGEEEMPYVPVPAVSSGVQANPHTR